MPELSGNFYDLLYQERHPDKPVTLASDNGPEPLISIWPKILTPQIKEFIISGKLEMKVVLAELNAKIVNYCDTWEKRYPNLFLNINSKKDLEPTVQKRIKTEYNAFYHD